MADLGYYDDKLKQDGDPNAQTPGQDPGGQTVGSGTSGVISGTGGQNNAGVGAGGQGSWTNIQAYLGANKKDTGSSQALQSKVGGVLNQEQSKLQQASTDTTKQANDQSKIYDDAKANTKEWVNQAANAYSWDNQHGDPYRDNVAKIKNLKTQAYQGPQNFSYANSQDLSRADDALKNDDSFKGYLGDLYKERTGGQLNAGQAALQNQFDVNNENLQSTRAQLASQMAGFGTQRDQAVKNTDQAIQDAQNKYRNNQAGYNDYLQGMMNDEDSAVSKAEQDARAQYNKDYTTGQAGLRNASQDMGEGQLANAYSPSTLYNQIADESSQLNHYKGDNLTYEQLQREKDHAFDNMDRVKSSTPFSRDMYGYGADNERVNRYFDSLDRNKSSLDNFYKSQDEKYAMTGDEDERKYNTLSEILGGLNKKEKGFKVRG
jgi:hypothetical protein